MVEMVVRGVHLQVLDPVSCLAAKISNAAQIDQTGRQDVKHVEIMKICASEYAKDIVTGELQAFSERVIVNVLERLRKRLQARTLRRSRINGTSRSTTFCRWKPFGRARCQRFKISFAIVSVDL
jgi:hypothetical protein